ncbi:hypothetical protein FOWG_03591 [Fusarium oxysporum f. sp. lycopersici MN25]|nr:hypothetical protein FOWG_03591 [Fusarium oxysporum f. sp. lycopersici MN25]
MLLYSFRCYLVISRKESSAFFFFQCMHIIYAVLPTPNSSTSMPELDHQHFILLAVGLSFKILGIIDRIALGFGACTSQTTRPRSGLCLTDLHATSIDPSLHGQ